MKKKDKHFLEHGDIPIPIPAADVAWENMRKKLQEKEEKQRAFWRMWLWLALVLLFVIAGGMWWLSSKNSLKQKSVEIVNYKVRNKKQQSGQNNKEHLKTQPVAPICHPDSSQSFITKKKRGAKQVHLPVLEENNTYQQETKVTNPEHRKKVLAVYRSKRNRINAGTKPKGSKKEKGNKKPLLPATPDLQKNIHEVLVADKKINSADTTTSKNGKKNEKQNNDSSITESKNPEQPKQTIEAGLFWSVPLPFNGTSSYFAGPNGSLQPYYVLLPGIWIGVTEDRSSLWLSVHPFASSVLADKPYTATTSFSGQGQTVETRSVHKLFGLSGSLEYDYNIKNNWWAGGGIQAVSWRSAMGTIKQVTTNTATGNTHVNSRNFSFNDSTWTGFTKFQMGAGIAVLYKKQPWQAGLHLNYYLVPIIEQKGQQNQFLIQAFFKWALFKSKK